MTPLCENVTSDRKDNATPLHFPPLRPAARKTFSFAVVFASLCASGFIICFSRLHANIARCVCGRVCVCVVSGLLQMLHTQQQKKTIPREFIFWKKA